VLEVTSPDVVVKRNVVMVLEVAVKVGVVELAVETRVPAPPVPDAPL